MRFQRCQRHLNSLPPQECAKYALLSCSGTIPRKGRSSVRANVSAANVGLASTCRYWSSIKPAKQSQSAKALVSHPGKPPCTRPQRVLEFRPEPTTKGLANGGPTDGPEPHKFDFGKARFLRDGAWFCSRHNWHNASGGAFPYDSSRSSVRRFPQSRFFQPAARSTAGQPYYRQQVSERAALLRMANP